ncbi:MAG: valine--tRNA ligase [Parcubacteria group bacterium]|nr:valine--tRNA ligase [Parcubacteria group bacterium]
MILFSIMDEKLLKPYNPKEAEDKIYKLWEESGFFNPDACVEKGVTDKNAEPYSIVLPPPNVTGTLHMGHAAMLAIEDILIRYNRMKGKKTLWIPGTDHAAIATESKVEEILYKKEKKTRHDLGRDAFLKRVEAFAQESHDTIVHQLKKMGSSLDWTREAFTLDEKRALAVRTAFKNMYDDGLIYQGERIVNWDPKMQSNVSDDEIEWVEQKTNFYYLKYGPFTIGTARPETKFGDKYVVMHPKDSRYKQYKHGDKIKLEWINGPITATVVKDEAVNMEFGTGVMTITPWHDATDFEIAERHNLDKEQIINERGILLPIAGKFAGEHIKKAREKIVEKLKQKGLLEKVDENYVNRIATNYRGGGVIEPQIRKQWFIGVNKKFKLRNSKLKGIKSGQEVTLKELMLHVVTTKQINIIPDNFEKTYFHWINNLRDWCISRQIWYGHKIPVWYKDGKIHVDVDAPKEPGWNQDPDTLDTWFSSGLWTFSTLGWPKENPDLKTYHPTSVLETGYDILFFWIARMILMSTYNLGDIPFKTVYLHGLVRDGQGRKMSKSLGNIINPLDMIEKYGADATRLSLIMGNTPGQDLKLSEDKVRGQKHFANKLWNVTRFVLENTEDLNMENKPQLMEEDEEKIKECKRIVYEITEDIERYRLYLAIEKLYHYTWHTFADIIIEESKPHLKEESPQEKKDSTRCMLLSILTTVLKLLHPFMPFVTEEIWSLMPHKKKTLLIVEKWPI